jgi:hypothetical protein
MSEQDTATINQIQPRWRNDKASIQLPKIHPISSQGYSQDIVRMLLGDSWDVQGYSQDAISIQLGRCQHMYSLDTAKTQPGYSQDAAMIRPSYSQITAMLSQDTARRIQYRHSKDKASKR